MNPELKEKIGKIREECQRIIEQLTWTPLESNVLPDYGVAVLGYNERWIDADFNPKGIRECVRNDHQPPWNTAAWNNDQDRWDTTTHAVPTHWIPMPEGPVACSISVQMARIVLYSIGWFMSDAEDGDFAAIVALERIAKEWEEK